jgi:hypothetical protein
VAGVAHGTWEYRWVTEGDGTTLESLGSDGWELVGVVASNGSTRLCFKRPGLDLRDRITLDQKRRYYERVGIPQSPPLVGDD